MSGIKSLRRWQDLPAGGVIEDGGNSAEYETGSWRTWRPELRAEFCVGCLTCWVFCPEEAIRLSERRLANGKVRKTVAEIDLRYCKGCGLCVRECPVNRKGRNQALRLVKEEM
jgi:pyruvate ferredoxin oxidoreductase delta subunit